MVSVFPPAAQSQVDPDAVDLYAFSDRGVRAGGDNGAIDYVYAESWPEQDMYIQNGAAGETDK